MDNRASDITSKEYALRVLSENLKEALGLVNKWGIAFDIKLEMSPALHIIVIAKCGQNAYLKTVHLSDIQYYSEDPETLISEIVESTFDALIKNTLRDDLRDPLKKALINGNRIAKISK